MHKKLNEIMKHTRNRIERAKGEGLPISIYWEDAEFLLSVFEAQQTEADLARNTINALEGQIRELKAELKYQKAVSQAELDTVHDLGDDYERALEDEQLHIQSAKIEVLNRLTKRLASYTDRYGKVPFEYVPMAALEILAEEVKESDE